MVLTILFSVMMMAGLFLMLWGGVGFIQDKHFFSHYYPETKGVYGRHLFGYNRKTHLAHIVLSFPFAALLSWICSLF